MSNKMTKKAQDYLPIYGPGVQGQMPPYKPIKPGSAFDAIDHFVGMSGPMMQGVQEQKRRSGTVKKDNFYNKYVVPAVNILGQLTPAPTLAYAIRGAMDTKKLDRNIKQYQKLHDNRQWWFKQLEDAIQNDDDRLLDLADRQLQQYGEGIRSNIDRGRQLSRDINGLQTMAETSAQNILGAGPMFQMYNMFANPRNRLKSFLDPQTHQKLVGMSPELLQMAGNAVAAKPFANIGNLILYSYLSAGPAGQAFRALPYIGKAPNAIQLASRPWMPAAQQAAKFGSYVAAGELARATAHNISVDQQRKSEQSAYTLPLISAIPGGPLVNGATFSAQNLSQLISINNALAVVRAAAQGKPIPKVPKIYAPYVHSPDVIGAVPGNMLVNGVPVLNLWDRFSNYAQYVPLIAPQSWAPHMPWFRGAVDPTSLVARGAVGPKSLDSGQQQRNQLAAQKLFKDADKYVYWPSQHVINSALYEPMQKHDNLAGAYADYVRTAAAASANIKSIPLPSYHHWRLPQVPELDQAQARSVFAAYAHALDTPNAFAGIELVQNSKEAADVRARYMRQLNWYINMLPDAKIADFALQYQQARDAATRSQGRPNFSRLLASPVLANLNLPESRYQNIISIYRNKVAQQYQRRGK